MINFEKYAELGENYNYVKNEFENLREILQSFKISDKQSDIKSVRVFLQGSYKNKTNIGKESDIDIVVYYDKVFNSNIRNRQDEKFLNTNSNITNEDIQRYDNSFYSASYDAKAFKSEVMNYLKRNSNYIITEGGKTIRCQIPNKEFIFDIICAFQYRLYNSFPNLKVGFIEGNLIRDKNNNRIINFPKQSISNSIIKNKNLCDGKYKETVRIIKNIMKNDINQEYWIPSFALECIIYNVANKYFIEGNKQERCKKVILDALLLVTFSWDKLLESNGLLFVNNINGLSQIQAKKVLIKIANLIEINLEDYDLNEKVIKMLLN